MFSPWQSYRALTSRHKIVFGIAAMSWATIGLYSLDKAEKKLGFEATEEEKKALANLVPRIGMVERNSRRDQD